MFNVELFLGFPVTQSFHEAFEKADAQIAALFIGHGEDYLQDVIYQEMRYLGKPAGKIIDIKGLELLENNILSILKKIVPIYTYHETSLMLFPVSHSP